VRTVYNEIQIGEPTSLASRADDSYITAEVKARFVGLKDKGFDVTRVKVVTENSVVYLMGLVNKSEAEDAVSAARRVSGVRKVVTAFEYVE
jgi:osmotically-inducible protein OsmY